LLDALAGTFRLWFLGAALALAAPAWSASFSISPVRVDLSPQEATVAITVANTGEEPVSIQLRTLAWRQDANEDKLEPTRDLIATPPLFTVPPGESQIVRVGLRRPPQGDRQATFRAIFEEIPGPPPPQGGPALRITLRISIPVFYAPREGLKSALRWTLVRPPGGRPALTVTNGGGASAQIGDLAVLRPGTDAPLVEQKNFAYVLPGATRSFAVDLPAAEAASHPLRLRTTIDGQPAEVEVAVE
jgi:fimbrial chaperone protein